MQKCIFMALAMTAWRTVALESGLRPELPLVVEVRGWAGSGAWPRPRPAPSAVPGARRDRRCSQGTEGPCGAPEPLGPGSSWRPEARILKTFKEGRESVEILFRGLLEPTKWRTVSLAHERSLQSPESHDPPAPHPAPNHRSQAACLEKQLHRGATLGPGSSVCD